MVHRILVTLLSFTLVACANAGSKRPGDDAGPDAALTDAAVGDAATDGGGGSDAGLCTAPCSDGVECTVDTCDPGTGTCVFTPDDERCGPEQRCDRYGDCLNIVQCGEASDCAALEDGNACNGTLHCPDGTCAVNPATVVVCDPTGYPACQQPVCQMATGACVPANLPDTTACDDANACTQGTACLGGACVGHESCCANGVDDDGDGLADCADADCGADPACIQCPAVADPDPVPLSPLAGESPAGATETTQVDGFTDDYLYNQAGALKVGARRDWGGSLIFYGMADGSVGMNDTNAIDANDTGREVQVAFYDPDRIMQNCAWNASCQTTPTTCPGSITYLGWNPVQGGNRCNHGSGVDAVDLSGGRVTVTTTPLFWNPNWDRQDCVTDACADPVQSWRRGDVQVVQRLRFVRYHVVELDYTVTNLAAVDHAPTAQEMPTLYAANGNHGPDLWRLFDSTGTEIPIDTPAGGDGFNYENFTSPGGWATMQDGTATYGVGLYYENRVTSFQGWQLRSLPFNNFRAIFVFGIPASASVRARAYLMLGALGTQQNEAAWLDANLAPFGVLDSPGVNATITGSVPVWGWALDNLGVTSIVLRLDGSTDVPLTYGSPRSDVCRVWPGYAGCPAVGYSGTLDTSTLTPCPHLLEVVATDTSGNQRVIARRRVVVTP
jgi:hypothetical protein